MLERWGASGASGYSEASWQALPIHPLGQMHERMFQIHLKLYQLLTEFSREAALCCLGT